MQFELSIVILLNLASSVVSAALPAPLDNPNPNVEIPASVLEAYHAAVANGSLSLSSPNKHVFQSSNLDAEVSTNAYVSYFVTYCQSSSASPWWNDVRDVLQASSVFQNCVQYNSNGCTQMGSKGTAAVGLCGPQGNSISCWDAYELGMDIINNCRNAGLKVGGYQRLYVSGVYGMYLDLLVYHS